MRTFSLSLLLIGLLAQQEVVGRDFVVYISPSGNDTWSGNRPSVSSDKKDGPARTLQGALSIARRIRATDSAAGKISIELRGGLYELEAPLKFTDSESGKDQENPLIIKAYQNEKPVISGGIRLTGWNKVAGQSGKWCVEIPEVAAGKRYFHQLFVDGIRQQRARTPKSGFFLVDGASPSGRPAQFKFHNADIKPAWANSSAEVIALLAWSDFRLNIRSVDTGTHVVVLNGDPADSNRENDARYYVENAPDGLDQSGEWYLDRASGILTYLAKPGEDPNRELTIASVLPQLVQLDGDRSANKFVHDLRFENIAFSYTDWSTGDHGYTDVQAAVGVPAAFRAEATSRCSIEHCEFSHLGGYAVEFGRGCQDTSIVRNKIFDIGAGGIRMGEQAERKETPDLNTRNEITDNDLHQLGRVFAPGIGIIVFQSSYNHIAHNNIHDLYYTAISVGWHWGYADTPCHHNVIEYNHLYDIGQGMLSDMGAVYTLGPQPGTVIRNNLVHDVSSFTYGGWGLYTDEGSSEILLENNVVYRTKSAGFHQHYGAKNIIRNNIFAFGREHQLMRTRAEDHLSFTFEHNIVYFDSGTLFGSNWTGDESKFALSNNVYFDARLGAGTKNMNFATGSFAIWQNQGHDHGSILADPLFANPEAADFTLDHRSPALALGFKPIDLKNVGARD